MFRALGQIALALFMAVIALADVISNSGSSGAWQPFPAVLTEGVQPAPYWDNQSGDGSHAAIGYVLTGQWGGARSPHLTNPPWLGSGFGAPASILFDSTGPNRLTLMLSATVASLEFGYFNAAQPGQRVALLTNTSPAGTYVDFTSIYPTYGFYITFLPEAANNDYYASVVADSTGSEVQALGNTHQHFAIFRAPGAQSYVIGVEDHWGVSQAGTVNERMGDYQDLVISLQSIPEPGSLTMLGLGLYGLVALAQRRVR